MSTPELNGWLPSSESMLEAFAIPSRNHFRIGKTLDEVNSSTGERITLAFPEFLTAAIAHIANRGHDDYMQEVGTAAWWMMNEERASMIITPNIPQAAMIFGIPQGVASKMGVNNAPAVILGKENQENRTVETATVLFSSQFLVDAQVSPIEALSTVAFAGSYLRDAANGRALINIAGVGDRAGATAAHFLREAVQRHPQVVLTPFSSNLLGKYPEGIMSLPKNVMYKGMGLRGFRANYS